jgi:transposase-like protein
MKDNTRQNSTDSTLTAKIAVIEALASGASVTDAAKGAGVDRTTIYHWRKTSSDFETQLALARRECADTMRARLRELAEDALKIVRETMTSTEISPAVRLKAALSVLQSVGAMEESKGDAALIEKWRQDTDPLLSAFRGMT